MAQDSIDRYPLTWPTGWKRTGQLQRRRATFIQTKTDFVEKLGVREKRKSTVRVSVNEAAQRLQYQLDALGATHAVLSTNLRLRLNGLPSGNQVEPFDTGAAVYFDLKREPRCLACDKWDRVADNIAAIANHIDALRRIDRYGVGTLEQAFTGYTALPPTAADWWIVLGLDRSASLERIEQRFRELAREHHPDKGGDHDTMSRFTAAREAARIEKAPVGVGA